MSYNPQGPNDLGFNPEFVHSSFDHCCKDGSDDILGFENCFKHVILCVIGGLRDYIVQHREACWPNSLKKQGPSRFTQRVDDSFGLEIQSLAGINVQSPKSESRLAWQMSCSLNSSKADYIGDCRGEYYRGYDEGC